MGCGLILLFLFFSVQSFCSRFSIGSMFVSLLLWDFEL
jgi:hypothetical protein